MRAASSAAPCRGTRVPPPATGRRNARGPGRGRRGRRLWLLGAVECGVVAVAVIVVVVVVECGCERRAAPGARPLEVHQVWILCEDRRGSESERSPSTSRRTTVEAEAAAAVGTAAAAEGAIETSRREHESRRRGNADSGRGGAAK